MLHCLENIATFMEALPMDSPSNLWTTICNQFQTFLTKLPSVLPLKVLDLALHIGCIDCFFDCDQYRAIALWRIWWRLSQCPLDSSLRIIICLLKIPTTSATRVSLSVCAWYTLGLLTKWWGQSSFECHKYHYPRPWAGYDWLHSDSLNKMT